MTRIRRNADKAKELVELEDYIDNIRNKEERLIN